MKFWQEILKLNFLELDYYKIFLMIFGGIIGAGLGSFICCQVRRTRLKEEGNELKNKRSVCLKCGYQLKWYDNVPIFSWLCLRGKCRKCKMKIGGMELIAELVGLFAGVTFTSLLIGKDVYHVILIVLMAMIALILGGLVMYDINWKVVPSRWLLIFNLLALIFFVVRAFGGHFDWIGTMMSVTVLSGIYYLLYKISKESWVGGGDWLIGLGLGLILADPVMAVMNMFLANFTGVVFIGIDKIISKMKDKEKPNKEIPMVPFLVIGFLISLALVGVCGDLFRVII